MKGLASLICFSFILNYTFSQGQVLKKSGLIPVNEVEIYYEVYGQGDPLFLLHGYTQSSTLWKDYISDFASNFEVYVIDLRGHGKSTPLDGPFSLENAALDIIEIAEKLKLQQINAIGFSAGGETLLHLGTIKPDLVNRGVSIGAAYYWTTDQDIEFRKSVTYVNQSKQELDEARKIHFHGEEQIKAIYDGWLTYNLNLTKDQIAGITFNAFIIQGELDDWGIDQAIDLHKYIPNSHFWIVPNIEHGAMKGDNKQEFIRLTNDFLMGKWEDLEEK
jgi:pimeloyl-ACP methyl ester carboxylesterase